MGEGFEGLEIDVVQVSKVDPVEDVQCSATKGGILGCMVGAREPVEGRMPHISSLGRGGEDALGSFQRVLFPPGGTRLPESLESIATSEREALVAHGTSVPRRDLDVHSNFDLVQGSPRISVHLGNLVLPVRSARVLR
jgi:hypothetical protein